MPENDIYLGDGVYLGGEGLHLKVYTVVRTPEGGKVTNTISINSNIAVMLVSELKKWLGVK